MVSNCPRFPLSCAEFHRRVLVKMVDWVRGYGWCASLLGLATLSASVSPQRHYLPPLDPAASVTPLCAVSTSVITRYVTTVETQWVTTTLSPSMESSHFLGYLPQLLPPRSAGPRSPSRFTRRTSRPTGQPGHLVCAHPVPTPFGRIHARDRKSVV